MAAGGSAKNTQGPAQMPDLSYGPKAIVQGVQLPANTLWENFKTIKVEIGVSQQWGHARGQLDHKAEILWARMPGVQYVLCIKTNDRLTEAHYKLYDVTSKHQVAFTTTATDPVAIIQGTRVHLDARRVLGIPGTGQIPAVSRIHLLWICSLRLRKRDWIYRPLSDRCSVEIIEFVGSSNLKYSSTSSR